MLPPGVDPERFRPLSAAARSEARVRFGLADDVPVVLGLSRLVPRKGFDVLIDAVAGLTGPVQLVIAGRGRDRTRLETRAARAGLGDRVRFLGAVTEEELPLLYGCADVFAMLCRDRWGGLEAEGFGVVFLEAAACGVPAVAGRSGGSHDAVVDGVTGLVVESQNIYQVCSAIQRLLDDEGLRRDLGAAARRRAERELHYDHLASRLLPLARGDLTVLASNAL
jgi:phosphatidylinositol alpha-1,6-mannosyltransferase